MFTLITEANLFTRRGAFLPPSLPNMGTGYIAGALNRAGIAFTALPWFPTYFRALCVEGAEATAAAIRHFGAGPTPYLHRIWQRGGEAGVIAYLRRAHQWGTSCSLPDYVIPERVDHVVNTLRDLYNLQLALLEAPADFGCPAVEVFVARCEELGNRLVGVSALTLDEPLTAALVRRLAAKGFEVIVGGALTSTTSPDALKALCFDDWHAAWLLRGNADHTLPELAGALVRGGPVPDLPGLMGRVNGGFRMGEDLPDTGLEEVATPDFSGHDLNAYYFPWPMLPLQTSRGCYWKVCAFCRQEIYGKRYRSFPVANSLASLAHYRETYGVRHVMLSDEALHPGRAGELAEALIEHGGALRDMRFCAAARTEEGFTPETLEALHRAGLKLVFWGVESGHQPSLDRMAKGTNAEFSQGLLRRAYATGVANLCFILVGFPGETAAGAMDTVRFLQANRPYIDYCRMNAFHLEPGTAVYRKPARYGLKILDGQEVYGAFDFETAQGMSQGESAAFALAMTRGDHGPLHARRFLPLPILGFGEEPMLYYFMQRVLGLTAPQTGPLSPGVAGDPAPPPAQTFPRHCPLALVSVTKQDGAHGFFWGHADAPRFTALTADELPLLRALDGTRTPDAIAAAVGTPQAPMFLRDLLGKLDAAGRLAWVASPEGLAD